MNKRGILEVGMALLVVFLIIMLVLFATIEPFKETLDNTRGGNGDNTGLNCPNTPTFNEADYNNDTDFEKLVRRPTCFVTGVSMIWFIFFVMIMAVGWVVQNWRKPK